MLIQFLKTKLKTSDRNNKQDFGQSMKYFFPLFFIQFILFTNVYSQTVSISGKISSNRIPIRNVSVTFIDHADTTNTISTLTDNAGRYQIDLVTSAVSRSTGFPEEFELAQNYPNPFAGSTAIPYKINTQSDITISIYDVLGRKVRGYTVGSQRVGAYHLMWDGRDQFGTRAANGVYFYKIQSNGKSIVKKMILDPGGKNMLVIPNMQSHSFQSSSSQMNKTGMTEGNVFTITLENTSTTSPLLVPEKLENVTIQNDTTINFSVEYIPLATFDFDSTHQKISGFGAATPWYLPAASDSEMESAFGMEEGQIGLTIFRLTIDPSSSGWSKWVPSAKKAHEMGAKIIASPWHAPTAMREPLPQDYRVKYDMYDDYAAHLNDFAKYMADHDAPVYGVSVQNEPDIGDWTQWTIDEMFNFVKNHGHLVDETKLMAPESFNFKRSYGEPILNDSIACANTDIICGHIYGGGLFKYPEAIAKGKEVWMTEYLLGENNSGNNITWAMELAHNINDVMQANMNAYVWWTMIRYYGPIGDGTSASNPQDPRERYPAKGEVTKKGYVLSQFSKYIRPGSYRVQSSLAPNIGGVDMTAYKDPSSSKMIIVAINASEDDVENAFRVNDMMTTTLIPYTTSDTKNCEQEDPVDVVDGLFTYHLAPTSITTFVSE